MSNTVTSYILVDAGGKLTVEDVNLAVHGVHHDLNECPKCKPKAKAAKENA